MKQSADNNFKFDENSRNFSKRVENTVGKGEIARYEQFLLFPQCFQKACFPGASKGVIEWEWVKRCYLSFSAFPTLFSRAFFHRIIKSHDLWVSIKSLPDDKTFVLSLLKHM